uniref:A to I editase domain-containing protein n=1 Tax=Knipowitschia caucasica TaxID=637954 RepID=A0AAV2KW78_KNICA
MEHLSLPCIANFSGEMSVLCKRSLFDLFLRIVRTTPPAVLPVSLRAPGLCTYWDYKRASVVYQQAWSVLRREAFPLWPRSDRGLQLFSTDPAPQPDPAPQSDSALRPVS